MPATIIPDLLKRSDKDGYEAWRRANDKPLDAVQAAWQALRWDPYWAAVEGKTQFAFEEAQRQFVAAHPELTFDQVYTWITQTYGGKFTQKEIQDAWSGRPQLSIIERQRQDDLAKYGDLAPYRESVWAILRQAGPGGLGDLINAYQGDTGDFDTWYNTDGDPNAWGDPAKFKAFVNKLQAAAKTLTLHEPSLAELHNWVQAEELNAQFKDMAEKELPGITAILAEYNPIQPSQKDDWRKANPEKWALIQKYYDFKDMFAAASPVWAQFYTNGTSSGGGGGSSSKKSKKKGGRGGGGSRGGSSTRSTAASRGKVLVGKRSTLDASKLIGGTLLGTGGVAGVPIWPPALVTIAGQTAYDAVKTARKAGKAIDKKTVTHLTQVAANHPEFASILKETLSEGYFSSSKRQRGLPN